MKAEDLRVGNLIQFEDGTIVRCTGIHPSGNYFHNGKQWIEVFRFKPIELTEEWLGKFGFVYQDALIEGKSGWYKYLNEGFSLYLNNHFQVSIIYSLNFLDIDINYIHQLQNLYFALTGQKLTIK